MKDPICPLGCWIPENQDNWYYCAHCGTELEKNTEDEEK